MPFFRWLFFRRLNSFFPTTAYASLFERIAHETWPCVGRGFSLLTPLPTCIPGIPVYLHSSSSNAHRHCRIGTFPLCSFSNCSFSSLPICIMPTAISLLNIFSYFSFRCCELVYVVRWQMISITGALALTSRPRLDGR